MSKATHTCSRLYEPASCALLSSHTLSSVQSSQTLHHVVLSVELLSDSQTSVVERISAAPVPSDGEWMGVERWSQELENLSAPRTYTYVIATVECSNLDTYRT